MTDYQQLLQTIYGNVHKLFGLIKDHEQDLNIVDKENSLMADAKTELLYLNDCIHSEITKPPNASALAPKLGVKWNQKQSYKQPTVTEDSDEDKNSRSPTGTHRTAL